MRVPCALRLAPFKILRNCKQGSLLLEALLSVVILSVSISVIIQAMTASLRSTIYSAEYTKAMILLENKMVGLMQQSIGQSSTDTPTDDSVTDEKFQYLITEDSLPGDDAKNLEKVALAISWKSKGKSNNISVSTYKFNPPELASQ